VAFYVHAPAEGEKAPSSPLIDCKMNYSELLILHF